MIKYTFYILLSALLTLGFYYGPDKDLQEFQLNTTAETIGMQTYAESDSSICALISGQDSKSNHSYTNETSNHNLTDGLFSDFSSYRNSTSPAKTLRISAAVMREIYDLMDTKLPENKWQGVSPDTNYIKYSNRYYVYTLSHILI